MTIEGSENIYTIKPEALDALVFDYDSLVVRDSLDLTASAGDLIKAVTVVDGKTVSYKTADTEAMTRIAAGMTALKPQEFASFHATGPELTSFPRVLQRIKDDAGCGIFQRREHRVPDGLCGGISWMLWVKNGISRWKAPV